MRRPSRRTEAVKGSNWPPITCVLHSNSFVLPRMVDECSLAPHQPTERAAYGKVGISVVRSRAARPSPPIDTHYNACIAGTLMYKSAFSKNWIQFTPRERGVKR